jgi:subtilisin family serine protease
LKSRICGAASEVNQLSAAAARVGGGQQRFTFETYFKGFSIQVSDGGLARIQEELPELGTFERARIYGIAQGKPDNPGGGGGGGGKPGAGDDTDEGGELIPWGVTRTVGMTDEATNIQDCGTNGASCLTIWVVDTGVDQDNADLNVDELRSAYFIDAGGRRGKNTKDDENGHGTHVAGTAAAIVSNALGVVGVAAGATVVSVRVLDRSGFGYNDEVLAGLNYVASAGACAAGEVVNISLGDDATAVGADLIDNMVLTMAGNGCLFALAAGNGTEDVSNYSPARMNHANIFTVSAVDSSDNFASFSNYGTGVDRAAPGVGVVSLKRNGGTASKSGTSMSAPHVAGLLALGGTNCVGSDGTVNSGDPDGSPDPIAHLGC